MRVPCLFHCTSGLIAGIVVPSVRGTLNGFCRQSYKARNLVVSKVEIACFAPGAVFRAFVHAVIETTELSPRLARVISMV